ncbi:MAG: CoA-binding protein [Parcubacteria group bacterium]|nr:CoA-binding protein [Parcubacteria group bacterium]
MNIVVVGASNNPKKYGHKIVRNLVEDGHTVYPVNPKERAILGLPTYRKVGDIERSIDIVNIVVPPEATLHVLRHIRSLGGRTNVWLQPGASSPEVLRYLEKHSGDFGIVTYDQCIETSLDRLYKT